MIFGFFISTTLYRLLRPFIFLFDSEAAHTYFVSIGHWLGKHPRLRGWLKHLWLVENPILSQTIAGVNFINPVGLAAGFDYEAQLTDILPSIGFGFGTVGTITNEPSEGNPKPRLGRLIESRSLLVNKGFKNRGLDALIQEHQTSHFAIPIGLSIGKTNSKESATQTEAVSDIVKSFTKSEKANLPFAYYELNISCPNLYGKIEFYSPTHLRELLTAITNLKLKKPVFIKMPISETNEAIRAMLEVISQFPVAGVIFGNLQKDRSNPAFKSEEMKTAGPGNFSGKPTQQRSDELIKLAYKYTNGKLIIIGCGGIFSAEDAYKKIRAGASLVQLITGLVYKGPQLTAQINFGLVGFLKRDGFNNLAEAVGQDAIGPELEKDRDRCYDQLK